MIGRIAGSTLLALLGGWAAAAGPQRVDVLVSLDDGSLRERAVLKPGTVIGDSKLDATFRVFERAGDFDGDGRDDVIVVGDDGMAIVSLRPATGSPGAAPEEGGDEPAPVTSPRGAWRLVASLRDGENAGAWRFDAANQRVRGVGDFDGDGHDDVLIAGPSAVAVLGVEDGRLTDLMTRPEGTPFMSGTIRTYKPFWRWKSSGLDVQGLGDVNGDGRADLVLSDESGTLAILTLAGEDRTFRALMVAPAGSEFGGWRWDSREPQTVAGIGDFTGDGRDELLVVGKNAVRLLACTDDGKMRTLVSATDGTRTGGWTWSAAEDAILGTGDLDGDGLRDLLSAGPRGIAVFAYRGDARPSARLEPLVVAPVGARFGGWTYGADQEVGPLSDLDGDGRADLVIRGSLWMGILKLSGNTFSSLALVPNGATLGSRALSPDDRVVAVGRFTGRDATDLVLSTRPPAE